jgi:ParB family chromosome partitioning protein
VQPGFDEVQDDGKVEVFVKRRIFLKIRPGKLEEGRGGTEPVFLQVDEGAGELDHTFVKGIVWALSVGEPKLFEDVVGLIEQALVETDEIAEVMGVEVLAAITFDEGGDFAALLAHGTSVMQEARRGQPTKDGGREHLGGGNAPGRRLKLTIPPTLRHSNFMAKPALGRGLGALLSGAPPAGKPTTSALAAPVLSSPAPHTDTLERVQRVALGRIRPCSFQPRKKFSDEALRELADSIKEQGIVQPLIVRDRGDHFELIAGERRWRASQLLGLAEVPVIVRQADDRAVLELALIENLQRENLNPIEEAHGYAQLIEQFQLKQEEVATKVGRSRAVVANALRLLKLVPTIQDAVRDGLLSVGHAKVILGLASEKQQKAAAERVMKDGLNVRQTEVLVTRLQTGGSAAKPSGAIPPLATDANVADLESRLRERFGTKVRLRYAQGKGSVEIAFFNDDDLERILQIVGVKMD